MFYLKKINSKINFGILCLHIKKISKLFTNFSLNKLFFIYYKIAINYGRI